MTNDDPSRPEPRSHAGEVDGPPDDALRTRFTALRREEAEHTPQFAALWRRKAVPPVRRWRWFVATACLLIVAAVFAAAVFSVRSERRQRNNTVASITEWKAPTDFLLETPGRELLRTVPRFGELKADGWNGYAAPLPPARPSQAN
jgi:hypothetical protein